MRMELVLGAACFAVILGASGHIKLNHLDESVQSVGVGAALGAAGTAIIGAPILAGAVVGAAGGIVYSQMEEPLQISLR